MISLRSSAAVLQRPDLGDAMRQRLLTVDVFAELHGGHGGHGMGVVRRADQHGVDLVAHFGEHDAEVLVPLRLGQAS